MYHELVVVVSVLRTIEWQLQNRDSSAREELNLE
jgi:hypothetical protein